MLDRLALCIAKARANKAAGVDPMGHLPLYHRLENELAAAKV
jgi:hypothetical protein